MAGGLTPPAAMCVQNADVQCVLQFALILAFGCVLHRRASRVIHRREYCLVVCQLGSHQWAPDTFISSTTTEEQNKNKPRRGDRSSTGTPTDGGSPGQAERVDSRSTAFRRGSLNLAALLGGLLDVLGRQTTTRGLGTPTGHGYSSQASLPGERHTKRDHRALDMGEPTGCGRYSEERACIPLSAVCQPCGTVRCATAKYALMILPQVPLRKPCYDFYFL